MYVARVLPYHVEVVIKTFQTMPHNLYMIFKFHGKGNLTLNCGYHWNRLFKTVSQRLKPLLTEFGIHHRLESYVCK